MEANPRFSVGCVILFLAQTVLAQAGPADQAGETAGQKDLRPGPGWARREVQMRLPGRAGIQALHERPDSRVPTRDRVRPVRPALHRKQVTEAQTVMLPDGQPAETEVLAYTINAPPLDGFVPWIAVHATNKRNTIEWEAYYSSFVQGSYLVPNPQFNYGIGLLDTGAGVTVFSNAVANQLGLMPGYNTGGTIPIGGVTGSVDAWVSHTFGMWITGLGSINPDQSVDLASMVGEWNVSVAIGPTPEPGVPDLFTAIGSPMAVYVASWIRNDIQRTVERGGTVYQAPDITFHERMSPNLPNYANRVPLELRPSGAAYVWYIPCFEPLEYCPGGDNSPKAPSLIIGASAQSLFFAGSVNLADRGYTAQGKTKFMVDTGAQVTVVGSLVAAQLGLNPNNPEFLVEIEGVDGQTTYAPGFYLDSLDIPALGQWLSYTQVPVVLLDVDSPEGGTLEGIIGMNLFTRYNFIFRGGGLSGMNLPSIDFEPLPAIDADYDDDGDVDQVDFALLQRCLSGADVPQTLPECSEVFLDGDTDVDEDDLLLFIGCARGPGITAAPQCRGL